MIVWHTIAGLVSLYYCHLKPRQTFIENRFCYKTTVQVWLVYKQAPKLLNQVLVKKCQKLKFKNDSFQMKHACCLINNGITNEDNLIRNCA